jgi:hypothetical protein
MDELVKAVETLLPDEERLSLEAVVNYAVQRGDDDGALTYEECWAIARSVVLALTDGKPHNTTAIPKPGFSIEVRVVRAAPLDPVCGRPRCSMPQPHDHFAVKPSRIDWSNVVVDEGDEAP